MGRRRSEAGGLAVLAGLVLAIGPAVAAGAVELPVPQEGSAAARRRAVEILARPELAPEPRSLLQRGLDEIGELLARVLGGVGGGSPVVAWVVVAAVSGVLALVLWRAVRALQTDGRIDREVVVDGRRRPAADWRAEAAAHEAAGRFRDGLRCSWRAVVADLASAGLVEEVPGRTTGEYRARVERSLPHGAGPFGQATRLFEDAWYAAIEIGPAEAAEVRQLGDQVLAEARR